MISSSVRSDVLDRADITWFFSAEAHDLPKSAVDKGKSTFRSIKVNVAEGEIPNGFSDLHGWVYEQILAGQGFGIEGACPSFELVNHLRPATKKNIQALTPVFGVKANKPGSAVDLHCVKIFGFYPNLIDSHRG